MAEPVPSELPIFELPLALVPAERVPLHIFEDRYRLMISDCIDRGLPFGIVLRDEDGARSIGCSALVADVVERHDDGRLDIIARGETPFRVLDRFEAEEWPAAVVEMIDVDDSTARMPAELKEAQEAFAKLLEAGGADPARAEASARPSRLRRKRASLSTTAPLRQSRCCPARPPPDDTSCVRATTNRQV